MDLNIKQSLKENITLIENAYQKIKQMIFQQKIVPGQRLVYKDLCDMLKMSRTPIINALNRLEQEGFLVSEAFRGFYVKPIDLKEARDLFGIREALETYSVERCIEEADAKGIEALVEKLLNHKNYMPNYYDRKKFILDAEFHLQIAKMAQNQVLVKLLKMNLEHIYLRNRLERADPRRMLSSVKEHLELVDKIKKKNLSKCTEIIKLHIRRGRDNILAGISREEELVNF